MTLPQIIKVYTIQNVAGLSFLTWLMYSIMDIPWIVYGIVHKEKPIVVAYVGWLLVNSIVAIGILIYS
jgi:uncharacterized protein with PQ loop repeat